MTSAKKGGQSSSKERQPSKYRKMRRKVCAFCVDKVEYIDYKNVNRLRRFVSDRGKILPRRTTGTCASHQRSLTRAIKRAREIALLPFTAE
jgi:small subunit ribosomal protein S18